MVKLSDPGTGVAITAGNRARTGASVRMGLISFFREFRLDLHDLHETRDAPELVGSAIHHEFA